jgi:anti-sigma factor RsiW
MAGSDPLEIGLRCERARQLASLRLDDELFALEEQLLERHLSACAACRTFEARIRSATTLVRSTPAESPSRRLHPGTGGLPRFPLERRGTALVVAAALALGALVGSLLERPSAPTPIAPGAEVSLLTRDVQQLQQLPRESRAPAPVRSIPPNPPEGVI